MPSARDKFLIDLLVSNALISSDAGDSILKKKQELDDKNNKINLISLLVREGHIQQGDVEKINELVLASSGNQNETYDEEYPVAIPTDEPDLRTGDAPPVAQEEDIPKAVPSRRPLLIRDLVLALVLFCFTAVLLYLLASYLMEQSQSAATPPKPVAKETPEVVPEAASDELLEYLGIGLELLEVKPDPIEAAKEHELKVREGGSFPDAHLLLAAEAYRRAGDLESAQRRFAEIPEGFPAATYRNLVAARIALDAGDYRSAIRHANGALEGNSAMLSARLARGAACFRGGLFDNALEDLNAVVASNPRDAEAKKTRGLLLAAAGERGAIEDLDYALSVKPDYQTALVRGALALEAGDGDMTRNAFLLAKIMEPERSEPLAFIALAEILENQTSAAEENAQNARRIDSSSRLADIVDGLIAEKRGRMEEACRLLTTGLAKLDEETFALAFRTPDKPLPAPDGEPKLLPQPLMPKVRAHIFLTRAKCLIGLGKFDEAEVDLARFSHAPGEPARPDCYRGLIAESQGDFPAAEELYSRAIRLAHADKWRVRCLTGRARARLKLGKRAAAIDDLEQAVTLGSEHAEAAWILARELFAEKKYRKARIAATALLKLDPRNAEALLLRGRVYLAEGRLEQAYNDFSDAISIRPDYLEAYIARSETASRFRKDSGMLRRALEDMAESVRLEPTNVEYRLKYAEIAAVSGDLKLAFGQLSEAAGLEPGRMDIIFRRAEIAGMRGDYNQAIKDFTKAAESGYRTGEAWLAIGLIYEENGQLDLAHGALEKASKVEKRPEILPLYLARLAFKEKKYSDARKILDRRFLAQKNLPEAWSLSGQIDLKLQNPKAAISAFNEAIKLEKLNGRHYYFRGLARYRLSRHKLALEDFLTAKSFNPELENLDSYIEAARAALREQK
ncbi:MAG: tetratricopeptide repeat protein [Planctomycetota bacterium]|jgi:tetratricopeptide (TPR) repeat protein